MNNFGSGRFTTMALLRMAVAAYLVYLGINLIKDQVQGTSTMPSWMTWGFGVIFILVGGLFAWYSWKRAGEEAETPPEEPGELDEPAESADPAESAEPAEPADPSEDRTDK